MRINTRSFISGLRARRRTLQLLGTAIVFFTFVLRDVLRENARTTKETYDAAEEQFNLRKSVIDLNEQIRHVGFLVLTLSPSSQDPERWDQAHWDTAHSRIEQTRGILALADTLRRILPQHEAEDANNSIKSITSSLQMLSSELENAAGSKKDLELHDPNSPWSIVTHDTGATRSQALHLFPSLLENLEKEAKHAQRLYVFFDWSSLVLYTVGVILAATGQLIGVETEPIEN
jgi:hypothetical protein